MNLFIVIKIIIKICFSVPTNEPTVVSVGEVFLYFCLSAFFQTLQCQSLSDSGFLKCVMPLCLGHSWPDLKLSNLCVP